MRNERGIELSNEVFSSLSVHIEMPSGATSVPQRVDSTEAALKLAAAYTRQMKEWPDFEAWIVLEEDNKEISREHIRT